MRYISYKYKNKISWGAMEGNSIIDLDDLAPSLMSAITESSLPKSASALPAGKPSLTIDEVTLLPPIPEPRRIICVGQNYAAHRDEMGGTTTTNPLIFTRYPSSLVGHNEVLIKPPESEQFDFEGELAVIIGKRGRRISPENALSHIAGYSCFMDGSIRDYQNHTTQYIPGKNFDQSGSFGPWMVSADEIPDPNAGLSLKTRLNDQVVQETTTDLMMFNIPTVIAYLSTFTTLDAGDVIASGTPGGVGYKRKPQLFMKPGDKIEVEIESVATLTNSIVGE
ncbi:MAG: 2-keto-4-pentenoate hydratase/2-oxohepta-3-ene-1,7-dioic acid hydratase in catechol pathway [Planctomycetota bacterium]|jgi:2-keto-4-pentenoate hydratase/2-oxohepta-3-ene-1,7-dioic acid hydratase in catechol pathway